MFVRLAIYFCNKAADKCTYENFDVLHQHFWQAKTKLLQLVQLNNKLDQKFEKHMKLTWNVVFGSCLWTMYFCNKVTHQDLHKKNHYHGIPV